MNKWVENVVEQNEIVQDEDLRKLMHESFDLIFDFLGRENFMRWINRREISTRIKQLAIEEFDAEDNEKHPRAGGFYTTGTDRIKLKDTSKHTNIHETYHFLTDNKDKEFFSIFIDEGMTEYLNILTEDAYPAYKTNVNFVRFLHNAIGNSIIKAYLTNKVESNKDFMNEFTSYLTEDGKPSMDCYKKINEDLTAIHKYLYANLENRNEEDYKVSVDNIKDIIKNIAVNYITKKAQNLEYYNDDNLDFKAVNDDINKTLSLAKNACIESIEFKDISFENDICKRMLTKVLENSHVIAAKENKDDVINDVINQIFKEAECKKNEYGKLQKTYPNINISKAVELTNDNENIALKLAELKLNNNPKISDGKNFNIAEFISEVSVIKEKTNMSELELDNIVNSYLLKNCPEGTDVKFIENLVKNNLNLVSNITKIEKENRKNTVESKFAKIDNNRYIEKRDNQLIYIELSKDGNIHEEPLKLSFDLNRKRNANYEVSKNNKDILFSIDQDMEAPVVYENGKRINDLKKISSVNELKTEVILNALHEHMQEKKYFTIENDAKNPYEIEGVGYAGIGDADVDLRSRKIDYSQYIQDLKSIVGVVPIDKQDEFVNTSVEYILNNTFGTVKDNDSQIYSQIENCIKVALNETDSKNINKIIKNLNNKSVVLDDIRKEINEEAMHHALVYFENDNSRIKYILREKFDYEKVLEREEKKFLNDSKKHIAQKEKFDGDIDFPGVYLTGKFNSYAKQNIDILAMISDVKNFLNTYPVERRNEKFNDISIKLLQKYYGYEKSPIDKAHTEKRKGLYTELINMMKEEIFVNKEEQFDFVKFSKLEETIHELSQEEFDHAKKSSLIGYIDDESREMFNEVVKINAREDMSDEAKNSITQILARSNQQRLDAIELTKEKTEISQLKEQEKLLKQHLKEMEQTDKQI